MKMKYRWIYLLVLLLFFGFVTGCGRKDIMEEESLQSVEETTAETKSSEAEEVSPRIGVSIYRYDDNFMKLYRRELKRYLEESYDAEVLLRNARGEQAEQKEQVKKFIEAGCDGIIINLVQVSKAGEIVDLCHEAGIPLVFINREPQEAEQKRWETRQMAVSCVGTDSRQAGTFQGEIILETPDHGDISGDGVVSYAMIMGEVGNADSDNRTEYSVKALKDGGMEVKNLFTAYGNWDEVQGRDLAAKALMLHGDEIEVMFCNNDAMANGARAAILETGRQVGRDIYLVGVDGLEETVGYVKEGKVTGTVLNDHTGQSHMAADVLMQMVEGEKVDLKYMVDYVKITTISTFEQKDK